MNLQEKLTAIEALTSEVLAELETMALEVDTRHSRYAQPNDKLIAAQILNHVRILLGKHKDAK